MIFCKGRFGFPSVSSLVRYCIVILSYSICRAHLVSLRSFQCAMNSLREGDASQKIDAKEPPPLRGDGESHQMFGEHGLLVRDRPIHFLLDARYGINGVERIFTLTRIFNVGSKSRSGCFPSLFVEAAGLGGLNFIRESFYQVLVYDAI